MFLKQHSVIDVIGGIILTIGLYFVVFKWWFKDVKFPAPVVNDPHQHQVLYFLNKGKK
jgi:membrane-associated phospholipid phosphatase